MQPKYSIQTEEPATEPITLQEAKAHLRVDLDDEDTIITVLIGVSRGTLESETNRAFIRRGFSMKMDCFPLCNTIELQHGDVEAETVEVKYFDESEAEQTLDSSTYWVDTHGPIARIVTRDTWPGTYDGRPNSVSINYDAGYADADAVPLPIKQAMLLLIGHLYENRQAVVTGSTSTAIVEVPLTVRYLITPYIIVQDVAK